MFSPDSRYAGQATYTVTLPGGTQVTAVVPPVPPAQQAVPLAGYAQPPSRRAAGPGGRAVPQRADRLLAAVRREQRHARRARSAARALIGIPTGGAA